MNRPYQAKFLHNPNDHVGYIDLPPRKPMARGIWKRVMRVMTCFTETRECEPDIVATLVSRLECPPTKKVADGIRTPGYMVYQENSHTTGPDKSLPRSRP